MKSIIFCLLISLYPVYGWCQDINDTINKDDAAAILEYLASDKLKGRVNFSREQLQAAEFISNKFANYDLAPFPGYSNYFFPFSPNSSQAGSKEKLLWNQEKIPDSSFIFISRSLSHEPMSLENFRVIQAELPLHDSILFDYWKDNTNTIIWINSPANGAVLSFLKTVEIPKGSPVSGILIVASPEKPVTIRLSVNENFTSTVLYNVIGVLPGKTKPGEAILFSAHYDHIDRDRSGRQGGIFNGANDNASGTTAILMLARYFSMKNDNDRTLIFCLFAGEELGLLGSQAFAGELNPESIKAVINIEMIGVSNIIGKNAFFVTGADRSDLFKILKINSPKGIRVMKEPFPQQQLFARSDNYTFALRGIPAHSVMCSDDTESCYHQHCDDVENLDIRNMTRIIQAIAKSCRTLISGEDTPKRIK